MPWVPRQEVQRRVNEGQVFSLAAGPQTTSLTFTALGSAGLLLLASCDAPGWLSLHVSEEAATSDAALPERVRTMLY